jgi:hypothetical protein
MSLPFQCQVCGDDALEILERYEALPRATSDAKPWPSGGQLSVCCNCGAIQKLPTERWRDDAASIYRHYDMYHLSHGAEQLVFGDSGATKPRSESLVDFILSKVSVPDAGKLIDVGCGNGEALRNFSRALPEWQLYGNELTDKVLPSLRRLPNFAELYTVSLGEIDEKFTLVTMFHSLEHMPAPLRTLNEAAALIELKGSLCIEVPDVETSPFDLLLADHLMHFSRDSLGTLAARAGVSVTMMANTVVPKEITMLGSPMAPEPIKRNGERGVALARTTVAWLLDFTAQIRALTEKSPIGIFGTSVAAMAFYGAFRDRVTFFIDEDPDRIGKIYDGKPVLAPASTHRDVPVIMALPPERAQLVAERLKETNMHMICPPPLIVA